MPMESMMAVIIGNISRSKYREMIFVTPDDDELPDLAEHRTQLTAVRALPVQ